MSSDKHTGRNRIGQNVSIAVFSSERVIKTVKNDMQEEIKTRIIAGKNACMLWWTSSDQKIFIDELRYKFMKLL